MNRQLREYAHKGDRFFMLRTGDDLAGLVFRGVFTGEPYEDDDWAGKGRQRHYMEMDCYDCVNSDEMPPIDLKTLESLKERRKKTFPLRILCLY